MGELGVLSPDDRVELLNGWIVNKTNHRPAHGFAVRLLSEWLQLSLPAGWISQCQLPITTEQSEPEPDLAVVHGVHADFRSRHPSGNDCRLVIEVADTSVSKDRAKATIYAAAGVMEYWIVNLTENQIERFTDIVENSYQSHAVLTANDSIETVIGGRSLRLDLGELLAP